MEPPGRGRLALLPLAARPPAPAAAVLADAAPAPAVAVLAAAAPAPAAGGLLPAADDDTSRNRRWQPKSRPARRLADMPRAASWASRSRTMAAGGRAPAGAQRGDGSGRAGACRGTAGQWQRACGRLQGHSGAMAVGVRAPAGAQRGNGSGCVGARRPAACECLLQSAAAWQAAPPALQAHGIAAMCMTAVRGILTPGGSCDPRGSFRAAASASFAAMWALLQVAVCIMDPSSTSTS